jgi:hypothetical protein
LIEKITILDPDLRIEFFTGGKLPSCFEYEDTEQDLVDFYNEDAEKCQNESISKVKNIYYKERLVGYYAFTTANTMGMQCGLFISLILEVDGDGRTALHFQEWPRNHAIVGQHFDLFTLYFFGHDLSGQLIAVTILELDDLRSLGGRQAQDIL